MSTPFTDIFTHADCSDGNLALWIAQTYAAEQKQPPAEVHKIKAGASVSVNHGELDGKVLLFLDTVPTNIYQIANSAKFVRVIDHHLHPNKAMLEELKADYNVRVDVVFDDKMCASELAWDYFYPNKPHPWFLQVVACNDCWRWDTAPPHFKPLWRSLFQGNVGIDFTALTRFNAEQLNQAILEGVELLQEDEVKIAKYVAAAKPHWCRHGCNMYYVLLLKGCEPSLISVVGNRLADRCAFAAIANQDEQAWSVSLRSAKDSVSNVGEIAAALAKAYPEKVVKGGGHSKAAGVTLKCELEEMFEPCP